VPKQASDYLYSVVIPVFNSEAILEKTIERTVNFFEQQGWSYEIIFVNDGSSDDSWQILEHAAAANPHIIAIMGSILPSMPGFMQPAAIISSPSTMICRIRRKKLCM